MKKYPVVTLCGSTRFKNEFMQVQKELTLKGNIVISVGLFGHAGDMEVWEDQDEDSITKTKIMLDDMHKRKIDLADEIFESNKVDSVVYGHLHGKNVRADKIVVKNGIKYYLTSAFNPCF